MDENARKIFDEAFATLDRTAHIEVVRRDISKPDALEEWRRGMPKPAPAPQALTTDAETLRWQTYIGDQIAAALAAHDELWRDVHGAVIAEERKRWRAEIEKLDLRLSGLLAEVTKRQTIEAAERRDGVIDLPMLPLRGRRESAT